MSKEKYLEELSDELRISKPMLKRFIHTVGTNKENIKDYAKNGSCAIVRKDNGFDVSYVAQMLNEKDAKIKELEHRLSNCIESKEDYYVIVSNGWKNKKYGIARVKQVVENYYIQETDEYLGSYSVDREYGEFATLEEAKAKLEELGK